MKTVLVSDIHGVDEALRQILAHHPDDLAVCLGDAVGNRHNDETLRLLKDQRPVWTHALPETTLELADRRYIVDVGSVGEPKRDADPRYVVWDGKTVTWKALP